MARSRNGSQEMAANAATADDHNPQQRAEAAPQHRGQQRHDRHGEGGIAEQQRVNIAVKPRNTYP